MGHEGMTMTFLLLVLTLGISTTFWLVVGGLRFLAEHTFLGRLSATPARETDAVHGAHSALADSGTIPLPDEVAVIVAAHNEALVIGDTIRSAVALVPLENIHVISDGSSDDTAAVAREAGAQVLELNPNRGKAGALVAGIEHFDLGTRFQVVLLLDADTRLSSNYLTTGLPSFADPTVVAVAGRVSTMERPHPSTTLGRFLVAYRERLYVIVQLMLKYGQAAKRVNAISIVPGFASMYRASVLSKIDIGAPGLVIEDFNMTFEIHDKQLGRIAFHPQSAVAYTQDPDRLPDYVKQVNRWTLGFWQTVRRHHFHARTFWVALGLHIVELVTSSVMLIVLVPLLLLSFVAGILADVSANPTESLVWLANVLRPEHVLVGVILPDYILTVVTAMILKRPIYLVFGLAFPLMRVIDAWICMRSLTRASYARSSGVWTSPARRATG